MSPDQTRVLIVEDDKVTSRIYERFLAERSIQVRVENDGVAGLETAREWRPTVILADWIMPEMDGLELARLIKGDPKLQTTYFIMLTAKQELDEKIYALSSGVDDYLTKPVVEEEMLARVRVGQRIYSLQQKLMEMSTSDPLTGVFNRVYLKNFLASEVNRAARYGELLCLMIIDCDDFKIINKQYGHSCGDALLRYTAKLLSDIVRDSDIIARYGSDEFAVLLPKATDENCRKLIERIKEFTEDESLIWDGDVIPVSFSVGIAEFDYNEFNTPEKLIKAAEQDLQSSKGKMKSV